MADRAPLVGMLNALPDQGQGVPLAGMPDPQVNVPFGELSVPHYSPSQRLGNAAQDVLEWLGAKPQIARHLVEGVGGVLGLSPAAVPMAAADLLDAKSRGDIGGTAQAALGMIPGAGPVERKIAEAAEPVIKGIRAYHGSPHDFDKFDLSKIGTGEGAQAYGHGLYFAGNENVAKGYRDRLSGPGVDVIVGGENRGPLRASNVVNDPSFMEAYNKIIPAPDVPGFIKSRVVRDIHALGLQGGKVNLDDAMAKSIEALTNGAPPKAAQAATEAVKKAYASIGPNVEFRSPGHMYEVNINADPEHFLDWDKPLSQHAPEIQEKIKQAMGMNYENQFDPQKAENLWNERKYSPAGIALRQGHIASSDEQAARRLNEAGIPGVRYLDQGSRAAGEGSRNYVVFNDNLIDIIRKYGLAGAIPTGAISAGLLAQPTDNQPAL